MVCFRITGYLGFYGVNACPFFDMMCISEKEIIMNGKPLSIFSIIILKIVCVSWVVINSFKLKYVLHQVHLSLLCLCLSYLKQHRNQKHIHEKQ